MDHKIVLESWDRQARIINNLATLIDEEIRHIKPTPETWSLDTQLAHIHNTRRYWLSETRPEAIERFQPVYRKVGEGGEDYEPIEDLNLIKAQVKLSGETIREVLDQALGNGTVQFGCYEHPMHFYTHMVWHDGYHAALIFQGLRVAGREPNDEWEEENVWGNFRVDPWILANQSNDQ